MIQEGSTPLDSGGTGGYTTTTMAAHELKAPLALIRQLALGLEEIEAGSDAHDRLIGQIRLTSERALRLTDNIMIAAQQEALFDLEPLNAVQSCKEVIAELTPLFRAQGRHIELSPLRQSPLLVGHPELLRRILLNFGDNALRYASSSASVRFSVVSRGNYVRIAVRDYGPAVPSDVWRRIQSMLTSKQLHPMSTRPDSSGLNLYLAEYFAGKMEGAIGIVRHRDGTSFYIDALRSAQLSLL